MRYAFLCAEDLSLGVGYLISYLKEQKHEVKLFFDPRQFNRGYARQPLLAKLLSVENHNIRAIKKYAPDVVMISTVTATYGWALKMAERVKAEIGCKVHLGGVHPTLVPEEVKKHKFIDKVVEGCGIKALGGKFEPDRLWADRESFFKHLPPKHREIQLFMTSFGCCFNCSFCGNEQLRKVKHHIMFRRTVAGCISELMHLKETGMKYVLFVDDILTCDKKFLYNFLKEYKEKIDLPFACFVHPKFMSEKIVKQLKEAGCHTAWMGIQTGNEQLRREVLNRVETNQQIIDCAKWIKEAGIKLMIDHIFGIPFETIMTQDQSFSLYKHIKPDVVNCYELLYFPKAKIIEHALRCGYLVTSDIPKIERGEYINYQQGNKGSYFYNIYAKSMVAIPLGSILWELLPMWFIKLVVHIKAGRGWMPIVMIQNELYFTVKAILKKCRFLK